MKTRTNYIFIIALFFASSQIADAQESDLPRLIGQWVCSTPDQRLGETVTFTEVEGGYDAFLSWWGQTAITASDGEHGSHVKISGTMDSKAIACFYNVSILREQEDIILQHVYGDAKQCPFSVELKRVHNNDVDDNIKRGDEALGESDYDTAIAAYKAALSLYGQSADAYRGLGDAYYEKEDNKSAVSYYSNSIRIDPDSSLYRVDRCQAYLGLDDTDNAISDANKALELGENDVTAHACRADAYQKSEKWDEELQDRKAVVDADPDDEDAQSKLNDAIQRSHMFSFRLCNDSAEYWYASLLGLEAPDSGRWTIRHWFKLAPHHCVSEKYRNAGGAYFYAYNFGNTLIWRAKNGLTICALNTAYQGIPVKYCSSEYLYSFTHISVAPDLNERTVDIHE